MQPTVPTPVLAHETWFVDSADAYGLDWSAFVRPVSLAAVAAVTVVAVVWRLVALRLPAPELPPVSRVVARLAPWVPRLLAVHLGASLLALAARGHFLSPAGHLPDGAPGAALALTAGGLGVWFVSGVALRPAAGLLIVTGWVISLLEGPASLLTSLDLLGVAAFLLLVPPGPDGRAAVAGPALRHGLLVLRLGVGGALISLAVTEKLANPALGVALLDRHPVMDLPAGLGLPISQETFILLAGAVELLFGLLVLSGALPQVVALVAAVPFTLTLLVFGAPELLGHLPVYGVLLALLVYGSAPATAAAVRWVPRRSGARPGTRAAAAVEPPVASPTGACP